MGNISEDFWHSSAEQAQLIRVGKLETHGGVSQWIKLTMYQFASWQLDNKSRALSQRTFYLDYAAVQVHNAPY